MSDLLQRGRGEYKTYWKNRNKDTSNYIKPETNDEHLVLGTGKNLLSISKSQCPECKLYFLTKSLPYHLRITHKVKHI